MSPLGQLCTIPVFIGCFVSPVQPLACRFVMTDDDLVWGGRDRLVPTTDLRYWPHGKHTLPNKKYFFKSVWANKPKQLYCWIENPLPLWTSSDSTDVTFGHRNSITIIDLTMALIKQTKLQFGESTFFNPLTAGPERGTHFVFSTAHAFIITFYHVSFIAKLVPNNKYQIWL